MLPLMSFQNLLSGKRVTGFILITVCLYVLWLTQVLKEHALIYGALIGTGVVLLVYGLSVFRRYTRAHIHSLQESQRWHQALLNELPGLLIVLNHEGRVVKINQQARTLLGTHQSDWIGTTLWELPCWQASNVGDLKQHFDTLAENTRCTTQVQVMSIDRHHALYELQWFKHLGFGQDKAAGVLLVGRDVSQQRATESECQNLRQKLAAYIDNSPLAMIEVNANLDVVGWNPAAVDTFQKQEEEMLDQYVIEHLFQKDCWNDVHEDWLQTFQKGENTQKRFNNINAYGERMICDWYNMPILNEQGQVQSVLSIVHNTTDILDAQEALTQGERRAHLIKEVASAANGASSLGAIVQIAVDTIAGYLNWPLGHAYLLETDTQQLRSSTIWFVKDALRYAEFVNVREFNPFAYNELVQAALSSKHLSWCSGAERLSQAWGEHELVSGLAYPIVVWGNTYAVLEFYTADPWNQDDETLELIAQVCMQITSVVERIHIENERQAMVLTLDKRVKELNYLHNTLELMFQQGLEANRVFQHLIQLLPSALTYPNLVEVHLKALGDVWESSPEWRDCEKIFQVPLEAKGVALGELQVGYRNELGTHYDVDFTEEERKLVTSLAKQLSAYIQKSQALKDLEQAIQVAEHASQAKTEFLATMSHEIRTPMNGVLGMIDVLQATGLRQDQNQMLKIMQESARSLLHIINDVLDVSKIEAGHMELDESAFACHELIEGLCKTFAPAVDEKQLIFELRLDTRIPITVVGDKLRIRQIITNLVGNALKFTQTQADTVGKIELDVLLKQGHGQKAQATAPAEQQAWQDTLMVRVKDNGIGIQADVLDTLFEPFTQAEHSTTRRFGGTGLGLTICVQLARMMGGDIHVSSVFGQGSTFTALMPITCQGSSWCDQSIERYPLTPITALVLGASPKQKQVLKDYAKVLKARWHFTERWDRLNNQIQLKRPEILVLCQAEKPLTLEQKRFIAELGLPFILCVRHTQWASQLTCFENQQGWLLKSHPILPSDLIHVWLMAHQAIASHLESPVIDQEGSVIEQGVSAKDQSEPSTDAWLGMRLLIAEDNVTNQEVYKRQLGLLGIAADFVDNGKQALDQYLANDYSLVLTDCHMPVMDGFSLTQAIRELDQEALAAVPIIAITANALAGEKDRCLQAGMDDYLSKPIELSTLKDKLNEWLPKLKPITASGLRRVQSAEGLADATPDSSDSAVVNTTETHMQNQTSPQPVVALNLTIDTDDSLPILDVTELEKYVGPDQEMQQAMLEQFIEPSEITFTELKQALEDRQQDQVTELAHKLKSAAKLVGAFRLSTLCERLEHHAKTAMPDAECANTLTLEFDQVRTEVQQALATGGS